jgi:hypothetical protein
MKIHLTQPFASNSEADSFDVRQLKRALNRLVYYTPYEKVGVSDIPDREIFAALKSFQNDHGLLATGEAKSNDETIKTMNNELSNQGDEGHYIWRTVDDDKVRGAHAKLNGKLRSWSDTPTPAEEYNCRCWAEPVDGKIIFPPHKPECIPELQKLEIINAEYKLLVSKRAKIIIELDRLIDKNNDIIKEMQKTLGRQIAAIVIGIPIEKLGALGDILQRLLGYTARDKILEEADVLSKELLANKKIINYKKGQFKLLSGEISIAENKIKIIEEELNECKHKHIEN